MRDIYGSYIFSSLFEESEWSLKETQALENAAATFGLGTKLFYDNVLQTLPGKSIEDIRKKGTSLIKQVVPRTGDPMPRNNIGQRELVGDEGTGRQGMDQIVQPPPQEVRVMDQDGQTEVPSKMERKRRVAWTDPDDERVFSMGRRMRVFGRGDGRGLRFGRGDGRGILRYPRKSAATKVLRGPINQKTVQASLIPATLNPHVEVTAVMMNNMTIRDGAPPPFNRNMGLY